MIWTPKQNTGREIAKIIVPVGLKKQGEETSKVMAERNLHEEETQERKKIVLSV